MRPSCWLLVLFACWPLLGASCSAAPATDENPAEAAKFIALTLRGRVVWLNEALRRKFGIVTDTTAAQRNVALEATDGQLYPIVEDARGRAFMKEPKLRDCDVEMLVRRYEGSPMVEVIQLYKFKPDGKYEIDYWCDVCAIVMYEPKQCECCQAPNRYRERRVVNGKTEPTDTAVPASGPASPDSGR
jgi:hypothetical protein